MERLDFSCLHNCSDLVRDTFNTWVAIVTTNNIDDGPLDEREIARKIDRLPKVIYAQGRAQYLEVNYMLDTVDRWYLSYSSINRFPKKRVFMHYEESTLDACVMKAWRRFAEHKNDWELFTEESND